MFVQKWTHASDKKCDENAKRKTAGFSFLYCDGHMGD